ncbi:hypothetical protein ACWGNF_37260, partial [Streptomyces sp. NPDC055808]
MGYQAEGLHVTVRLDRHAGERQALHNALWCELQWRVEGITMEGKYDTINADQMLHDCQLTQDECDAVRARVPRSAETALPARELTYPAAGWALW